MYDYSPWKMIGFTVIFSIIVLFVRRIKTYLPAKKKLAGNEVPVATIKNREKLKELEDEQKVC